MKTWTVGSPEAMKTWTAGSPGNELVVVTVNVLSTVMSIWQCLPSLVPRPGTRLPERGYVYPGTNNCVQKQKTDDA